MKTDHMIRPQISGSQTVSSKWCNAGRTVDLEVHMRKAYQTLFNVDRSFSEVIDIH